MKCLAIQIIAISILSSTFVFAEEQANEEQVTQAGERTEPKAIQKPEQVDISDLEEDYWRPNKDELEVVQNRRYNKKGRFEVAALYGIYQGKDFVNSKAAGASVAYNISNAWFVEVSHLKVSNQDNDFLNSVRQRFGFTPDFNREQSQSSLSLAWVPIYAKFSLFGEKISHFEMYFAPGVGVTKTLDNHLTGHFTVGEKFFLTENLLFRVEWKMSRYKDRIPTTQGTTSVANGGSGFVDQNQTTHNIIFGLGWMF